MTDSLLEDCDKAVSEKPAKPKKGSKDDEDDEVHNEKLRLLLKFEDAPEYLQHNKFILSGYRGMLTSKMCLERFALSHN